MFLLISLSKTQNNVATEGFQHLAVGAIAAHATHTHRNKNRAYKLNNKHAEMELKLN